MIVVALAKGQHRTAAKDAPDGLCVPKCSPLGYALVKGRLCPGRLVGLQQRQTKVAKGHGQVPVACPLSGQGDGLGVQPNCPV